MQTPNQFSQEPEKAKEESIVEQGSQPFYEFPVPYSAWSEEKQQATNDNVAASQPMPVPDTNVSQEAVGQQKATEDLIRQGLVYPPPPSFYQQPQALPPLPPLANNTERPGVVPPPEQPIGYVPPGGYGPVFAPVPPMPPRKKSYKWIWITVSALAVLLLAGCGLCGWAFSQFVTPIVQSETDAINTANNYYAALQDQDYAGAYHYVQPQGSIRGLTDATFTQRARTADGQYGVVRSYTTGTVSPETNPDAGLDFSSFTIVMNVTRVQQSYRVLLTLHKSGSSWKIIDFDRI